MRTSEKQELKKKISRVFLFLLIVLVPILCIEILLAYAGVHQWVNIMILVVIMFILYSLFVFICGKLDKKKQERMKNKKDPFSD